MNRFRKKFVSLCFYLILPLVLVEIWVNFYLFEHASYTNSRSLDQTIKALNRDRKNHEIFFFGDSEVHWGVNPVVFDNQLKTSGMDVRSFNFGIDGFSGAINYELLKKLETRMFKGMKVALIGVQLIEYHNVYPSEAQVRQDQGQNDLKRPVFLSPFGIDHALTGFSEVQTSYLDLSPLKSIRYRKAIKSFLMKDMHVIQAGYFTQQPDGFSPHLSIRANPANYALDVKRKKEERAQNPGSFTPLDPERWERDLQDNEYFDQMARFFLDRDVYPVFFALPTNPWYIDFKNRRQTYAVNSRKLSDWAEQRGLSFIDLGILDAFSAEDDFADFRHLSHSGAARFSRMLAEQVAELSYVQKVCRSDHRPLIRAIKHWNSQFPPVKKLSAEQLYTKFKATHDIAEMSTSDASLEIAAGGNDPWMVLGLEGIAEGKSLVGRIEIETEKDTTFSISWVTDQVQDFNSEMTSQEILTVGKNVIYVLIKEDHLIKQLRIDPGQQPGKYKICSLSYKMF
ncbi:hypothetical protein [Gimesia panareensis]|uniref:hypothetical protein n=1 Tax=Gimesia panareensis TaxID=2527978 RepID=UPI0011891220|nr:hypothetical protein [Gimesia panareensis]QDU51828.1 hypothetical protein Pan110_41970 [Gimesia panareensis]